MGLLFPMRGGLLRSPGDGLLASGALDALFVVRRPAGGLALGLRNGARKRERMRGEVWEMARVLVCEVVWPAPLQTAGVVGRWGLGRGWMYPSGGWAIDAGRISSNISGWVRSGVVLAVLRPEAVGSHGRRAVSLESKE